MYREIVNHLVSLSRLSSRSAVVRAFSGRSDLVKDACFLEPRVFLSWVCIELANELFAILPRLICLFDQGPSYLVASASRVPLFFFLFLSFHKHYHEHGVSHRS